VIVARTGRRSAAALVVVLTLVAALGAGTLAAVPVPAAGQDEPPVDVGAEPAPQPPLDPSAPTLSFEQLGLGPSLGLGGRSARREVVIPVPAGMAATSLTAVIRTSSATSGGSLEVRADDVPLAAVDLDGATPAGVPLSVPLDGVPVEDGVVLVELVTQLDGVDDERCAALLTPPEAFLVDGVIAYAGTEQPVASVSRFLPPVLTQVDLVLPSVYSSQQAEAALRLAANVALQYGTQEPAVDVHVGEVPGRVPSPFRRTIELVQGEAGVAVTTTAAGTVLTVSGDGASLAQQVDLLTSQLDRLAVASSAAVMLSQPVDQELVRGRRTVAALGFGNLQGTGVGRVELAVPFSQAALGGPTSSIVAHLLGTTTPVPDGASASLSVVFNDVILSSQALDASGAFDVRTELPDGLLRRDNDVVLRVDYTPPGGLCDPGAQQMTVQLDPSSLISGSPGTSLPDGFERFPQAFLPTFTVALGTLDGASLSVATDLVVALQRTSARLLRPEVHPWAAAVSSPAPTLFVGQENVDFDAALQPPLQLLAGREVQATTEPLQVQLGGEVAAVEAFSVGSRDVLLATWQGQQDLLVDLAGWVADPEGWRGLLGDAVVLGAVGEPEQLSLRTPAPGTTVAAAGDGGGLPWTAVAVGALALLVVVLAVAVWRLRRRPAKNG
jgi:hypothetical protein